MRVRSSIALLALAGACGDNDGGAAIDAAAHDAADVVTDASPAIDAAPDAMPARFDLDIVVRPWGVEAWMSGPLDESCFPRDSYPQPGACVNYSDFISCDAVPCLERVAVERGGVELDASPLDAWWWVIGGRVQDMFADGDVELVIEGCGGTFRVTLGRSDAAPAPTLTELTFDGIDVRGTIAGATGATGIIASGYAEIWSSICHEPGANALRMWSLGIGPWTAQFSFSAIVARPPVATPWGEARIWSETPRAGTDIAWVAVLGSDAVGWVVGRIPGAAATLTIDGGAPTLVEPTWGFRSTAAGLRLHFTGGVTYTAGETMDTLALVRPDGRYTGTFAHVTPTNDLDLSFDGDTRVALTLGPITLTNESNPALTHQVTVAAAWDHPRIPRPVP